MSRKVLKDSLILCSSPISANIFLNIQIELFSLQGIYKPVYAIKSSNPVVFKHTVLPPVFGPVMIKQLKSCPNLISIGTILFLSINGWRAPTKFIYFSVFKMGLMPSILLEYETLADKTSNLPIIQIFCFSSLVYL